MRSTFNIRSNISGKMHDYLQNNIIANYYSNNSWVIGGFSELFSNTGTEVGYNYIPGINSYLYNSWNRGYMNIGILTDITVDERGCYMTISKMKLLRMCRNFFLFTVFLTIFSIWGFFYAYSIYKIFGLIIMAFTASGILPYFFKNTYIILDDISKMNTDIFEGKIERIEYSRFRDILPCGIFIFNKKNEREKSGTYHLNVKIRARVGSWVKIQYLNKSKIIIDYEVIKY